MPTTTTLNTRLFAPQVILTQDTTRLAIKLKPGEGYTIPSGFTLGDVIRYDPNAVGYTLSRANTEVNAEVLGVIESISSNEYTVVCSGSIKYPTTRLSNIVFGGGGGIDVLFLDELIAGGLTGTIDQSSGSEKIVKPVMQIAPHAGYNGVIMNYVGYKTGTQAVSQEDSPLLPVGSIMYSLPNTNPGINWLRVDSDIRINIGDYSELYSLYGLNYGPFVEKIRITEGSNINSGIVGRILTTFEHPNLGVVIGVNNISPDATQADLIILVTDYTVGSLTKFEEYLQDGQVLIGIDGYGFLYASNISSTEFTVPAVVSGSPTTQQSDVLVPFIKAYESVSIKIPEIITLTGLTATNNIFVGANATVVGNLQVGNLTNIEAEIQALKAAVFP